MSSIESLRLKIRPLLHLSVPADALFAYYAFYHDSRRTSLYVHDRPDGRADGFVAVCQTGQRLFTPTVALRTPNASVALDLLREALLPGRLYYLITTPDLRDVVTEVLTIEQPEVNHLYRLELHRLHTALNVLVTTEQGGGRYPRFVIRSQGQVASEAGVNWMSPHYAELFVQTKPWARGRGWGRAVLAACSVWVVRSARHPLCVVNAHNEAGLALARSVGYVDTGVREFAGEGICRLSVSTKE